MRRLIIGVMLVTPMLAACSTSHPATTQAAPATTQATVPSPTYSSVAPVPGVADVAKEIGATRVTDNGAGLGTADSGGACYHGQKVGINTFASKAERDSWLNAAEPLGVRPMLESDQSVVYPSVDHGGPC